MITAKGSVFVNGIEYSTTGATIRIDDNPGIEDDLKVGMVVTVRGTSDDSTRKGTATQVEARDILEGTISSVDAVNKTITVMGQTVRIEDNVTRLNDDDTQKVFANAAFLIGNTGRSARLRRRPGRSACHQGPEHRRRVSSRSKGS